MNIIESNKESTFRQTVLVVNSFMYTIYM